ncbi:MAG TPA: hypothetical protein VM802_12840 [Chitinophaga sp.]|uniref:DinB family protein n=1 Tax=Chitinophaga sp. TaxID=1869181 RepID=UPI002CB28EF5|nr:DinB family protein [Chitinophaga sp.]HVI45754.1 hypothetical protein [Chitinophaga sp.]
METLTSKKPALEAFLSLYDYHSKLFVNSLAGVSEKDAANRLGTKANHIGWIAGSLLYQRFSLASFVGIKDEPEGAELFKDWKGIQDDATYPSPQVYVRDWQRISPILRDAFAGLSEEELNGPDPLKMPGGNYTLFDTIMFCIDRESYCIGQIGLLRRQVGLDAMKYD